jgi:uncharacterized protein YuzE
MRMTYDPDADAAYIFVSEESRTAVDFETCGPDVPGGGAIIMGYDEDMRLVGIEILGASRLLSDATLRTGESGKA